MLAAAVVRDLVGRGGCFGAAALRARAGAGRAAFLAFVAFFAFFTVFAGFALTVLAVFARAAVFFLADFALRPVRDAGRRVVVAARRAAFRDAFAFAFFAMSKPLRAYAQVRNVLSVSEGSLP
jgi:hypothetical protein